MNKRTFVVLVVEDDPNDQFFIETSLRKFAPAGSHIRIVENGVSAISYLMGEGIYSDRTQYPYPTLVITDLNMPEGTGFMLLEHLKVNQNRPLIPTVVLSASEDANDIRTAYLLGAGAYHTKPTGFAALSRQLQLLCDYWVTCKVP